MILQPKTIEGAKEMVYHILNQGDSRYNNTEDEINLDFSIFNQIVSLEEREIPPIKKLREEEMFLVKGVQKDEKYVSKILLKKQGFQDNDIFFEKRFLGSIPDVLAKKETKTIAIECCSCRTDKILEYLPKANEIWNKLKKKN